MGEEKGVENETFESEEKLEKQSDNNKTLNRVKNTELGWASRKQTEIFRQNPDKAPIPFFSIETVKLVFTPTNILTLLWFTCGDIRANAYVSQVQPWLEWTCNQTATTNQTSQELQEEIDYWQNWYNYCGIIGIAINPILGLAMDGTKKLI